MIKFLFIFLFSLNASANLFGRGMLMTSAKPLTIVNFGSYRAWSDGSYATSCNAYKNSGSAFRLYSGSTGSGIYKIKPSSTVYDVYCNMTSATEGLTRIFYFNIATGTHAINSTYDATGNYYAAAISSGLTNYVVNLQGVSASYSGSDVGTTPCSANYVKVTQTYTDSGSPGRKNTSPQFFLSFGSELFVTGSITNGYLSKAWDCGGTKLEFYPNRNSYNPFYCYGLTQACAASSGTFEIFLYN